MPARNVNIIVIAICASLLCYFVHRRAKTAMMVGDALEMIEAYYVDPVDQEDLLIAAMDGMTATLDEHTHKEDNGDGSDPVPGSAANPIDVDAFQDDKEPNRVIVKEEPGPVDAQAPKGPDAGAVMDGPGGQVEQPFQPRIVLGLFGKRKATPPTPRKSKRKMAFPKKG